MKSLHFKIKKIMKWNFNTGSPSPVNLKGKKRKQNTLTHVQVIFFLKEIIHLFTLVLVSQIQIDFKQVQTNKGICTPYTKQFYTPCIHFADSIQVVGVNVRKLCNISVDLSSFEQI